MIEMIKTAVVGYGHVGVSAVKAIRLAPDMILSGVVTSRPEEVSTIVNDAPVVSDMTLLADKPDVAILSVPSRAVEEVAPKFLSAGINTVDSVDMHGEPIMQLRANLDAVAKENGTVAIISSGVDPGASSMIRAIFEAWAPNGLTYVEYGPGMSLGHSVVAKSKEGVKNALSVTRPGERGKHKRDVYLETEPEADFEVIKAEILTDSYFCNDDVEIFLVDNVSALVDTGHKIHLFRKGSSSGSGNQLLTFDSVFNNPSSTAQLLVATARASMKMPSGAYTMLEIPLNNLLYGEMEVLLKRLI
jgi:diaminopimelate dehydrogenase